jgi:hypothetical protein
MSRKKAVVWTSVAAGVTIGAAAWLSLRHWRPHWSTIQGAVIRRDADPRKEAPIAGVLITASHGTATLTTLSGADGFFQIAFPGTVLPGQSVDITFQRRDYQTLEDRVPIRFRSSLRHLIIASMIPVPSVESVAANESVAPKQPLTTVQNIKVRYSVNSRSDDNIGSAVRTFQVVNRGDVPCHRQNPCSPDGFWKASTASVTLDAGAGNEFRDVRASCIAGPCPFTRIDTRGFANGDRTMTIAATDWSDTATFLMQAEVFHTEIVSEVRESYPVVFGTTLNFTVPATAEGVSLEAELNGVPIVFPLGPDLYLNWASCAVRTGSQAEKSPVYQCGLKPGFRF